MKYCPITYDEIDDDETYSLRGLKQLSPQLKNLKPLAYSAAEQHAEATALAGKMSIQGVQSKLSAQLKIKEEKFELVAQNGHYILKPPSHLYAELPQNEALTMTLAKKIKLEVPVHGLVYGKDNSMTYFVKRFDRGSYHKKFATEDFSQLLGFARDTKYNSSMEQAASVVETFCSFPRIELVKLFKLTLFNFLIGNEDMHLKNFSLITRDYKITLSPAYDLLNTTIAQKNAAEELALPLKGKKNNLTKNDFLKYFAIERLRLNPAIIARVLQELKEAQPTWEELIQHSFLSKAMQKKYLHLLQERRMRLGLP